MQKQLAVHGSGPHISRAFFLVLGYGLVAVGCVTSENIGLNQHPRRTGLEGRVEAQQEELRDRASRCSDSDFRSRHLPA